MKNNNNKPLTNKAKNKQTNKTKQKQKNVGQGKTSLTKYDNIKI